MKKAVFIFLFIFMFSFTAHAHFLDMLFGDSGKSKGVKVKFLEGDEDSDDEILLISIKGTIQEKEEASGMMLKQPKNIIEEITKNIDLATKRKSIKAILLEINSPGGEVTCCDIITHKLTKFSSKTGKPIIALIGSMGASGGYHIACSAQKIIAQPTSVIGSIGVIMQSVNMETLADYIGIKAVTIKSERTPMKDILSPFRKMTEEEEKMLKSIVDSMYDRFVDIVANSRKMKREDVIKLANGGIYTSQQAKTNGLIDEIGYREDAMELACKLVGLKSAALVRRIEKRGLGELLGEFAELRSGVPALLENLENNVKFGSKTFLNYK